VTGKISVEKQSEIKQKLESMAVPMDKREFTKEEYNKLFPRGTVKTPIEIVKTGEHQFEKLDVMGRRDLLGAMHQTLRDPIVILEETREGEKERVYIKSFKNDSNDLSNHVIAVVVDIEKQAILISAGKRRQKQINDKIKMADRPLYIKGEATSPSIGTDEANPATQQDIFSPQPPEKSRASLKFRPPLPQKLHEGQSPIGVAGSEQGFAAQHKMAVEGGYVFPYFLPCGGRNRRVEGVVSKERRDKCPGLFSAEQAVFEAAEGVK
jgi:hypothetical protein